MNVDSTREPVTQDPLAARAARGRHAWRRLGWRLQAVTPRGLVRFGLALLALGAVAWLLAHAWFALLPFTVGLLLAYISLPLVDRLGAVLPRPLAALAVVLVEVLGGLLCLALLLRPLVEQATNLVAVLPTPADARALLDQFRGTLQTLPPPVQVALLDAVQQALASVRQDLPSYLLVLAGYGLLGTLGVVNIVGFLLGFVAVPAFLLAVLTDQREGTRWLYRLLPAGARDDVWAVLRILDRTFGPYLRGLLLKALAVGLATFGALYGLHLAEVVVVRYPVVLALGAALASLIPIIGALLGALPIVLVGLFGGPSSALLLLGGYVGALWLVNTFVAPRIEGRAIDMHPAVLATVVIALSQLGLAWLVLAAPAAVAARDLYRYAYGRLGETPQPAGLLPGEPLPRAAGPLPLGTRASALARASVQRRPPDAA